MITEKLGELLTNVAKTCGYDDTFTVILSNRPELCDYQSDTAFQLAKKYHKAPMMIGTEIVDALKKIDNFINSTSVLRKEIYYIIFYFIPKLFACRTKPTFTSNSVS